VIVEPREGELEVRHRLVATATRATIAAIASPTSTTITRAPRLVFFRLASSLSRRSFISFQPGAPGSSPAPFPRSFPVSSGAGERRRKRKRRAGLEPGVPG
jgi:hypothetical protein